MPWAVDSRTLRRVRDALVRAGEATVSSSRRDVFDMDEDLTLDALRLAWGDAYGLGHEDGRWITMSRDEEKRTFTGDTPDALNQVIRAAWAREGTL